MKTLQNVLALLCWFVVLQFAVAIVSCQAIGFKGSTLNLAIAIHLLLDILAVCSAFLCWHHKVGPFDK